MLLIKSREDSHIVNVRALFSHLPSVSIASAGSSGTYIFGGDGCQSSKSGDYIVWCGFVATNSDSAVHGEVAEFMRRAPNGQIDDLLNTLGGEFCLIRCLSDNASLEIVSGRVGMHPVYFYEHGETLVASDRLDDLLRALQSIRGRCSIDREYVGRFLLDIRTDEFGGVPLRTIYSDVWMVPAGCYCTLGESISVKRYWRFWEGEEIPARDCPDAVRLSLIGVVKSHSNSERTGALVSGGLDSSSIACVLASVKDGPIDCYSSVFRSHASMDESAFAEAVSKKIHCNLREIPSDGLWAWRDLPDLSKPPQVEPYQGWFYAQEVSVIAPAIRNGVKVMMNGYGGDELFDPSFAMGRYIESAPFKTAEERLAFLDGLSRGRTAPLEQFELRTAQQSVPEYLSKSLADGWDLTQEVANSFARILEITPSMCMFYRVCSFRYMNNTANDCLWTDREVYRPNGMRFCSPFLDNRFVETMFRVPISALVLPSISKPLLRMSMKGLLPEAVRCRKLKSDFSAIYEMGMLDREAMRIQGLMRDAIVYDLDLVEREAFRKCLSDFRDRVFLRSNHGLTGLHVWNIICLEIWLQDQLQRGGVLSI